MKLQACALVCAVLAFLTVMAQADPPKSALSEPGWTLVWADEFSKDGAPDPSNWNHEQGFVRNKEAQRYESENAVVKGGMLVIEARRVRTPNPSFVFGSVDWTKNRPYADYTSASVTTRGKHAWLYGRWEMRAKIETRPGLWPAFWTVGAAGGWPRGGEIDILEYYHGLLLANAAWGSKKPESADWSRSITPLADFHDPEWSNKFHVWRMDWDPDWIRLFVDDRLLNSVDLSKTINPDGTNPFHAPQSLILNMAVGGQGGDPAQTAFPARYFIDYVRIYQKTANQ